MLDFLGNLERTHMCGTLRAADAGQAVVVMGWVNRRRDHGNLIFLDLRDRSGICQVVLDAELVPEGHAKGEQVRPEYVVAAVGKVRLRAPDAINPKMSTGEVEIEATELRVLNDTRLAPFSPADEAIQNEEVRLKYRYVDLRRAEMQHNFRLRHEITRAIRESLSAQGFLEIETPILCKSTPEGARDFLVPSRVHAGEFYALPQSPQIFKQILMISGFDRYFQIARCFRDEDLRADRQLEFTQVDLEMSFPRQEHVFAVVENFMEAAFAAAGVRLPVPFPKISYDEAMRRFGTDKPDLRLPGLTDVRPAFPDDALQTLAMDPALPVVALRIPRVGELSRKEREENHPLFDKQKGAKFIDDFKRLQKSFPEAAAKVREMAGARGRRFCHRCGGRSGTPGEGQRHQVCGPAERARNQRVCGGGQLQDGAGEEVCRAASRVRGDGAVRGVGRAEERQDGGWRGGVSSHVDRRFSDVRVRPGHGEVDAGASSVYRAARGGHGQPGQRSGERARQLLRPGDERTGVGFGVDPDSSQGRAAGNLPVAGHQR